MTEWHRRRFISTAGLGFAAGIAGWRLFDGAAWAQQAVPSGIPDEILNPVEVSGDEAALVSGRLPGAKRLYVLPEAAGEFHRLGGHVMKRIARPSDSGGVYELIRFAGNTGAAMPRHVHLNSHAAVIVLRGRVELELGDARWTMMRGDFANIPAGTAHGWTMQSENTQLALFAMNDRVGAAFVAMGEPDTGASLPDASTAISDGAIARAGLAGDYQRRTPLATSPSPVRVTNARLGASVEPYVIADGGGDRYGGNTFLARNTQTNGQFLVIITEGGAGPGVPAHFHARHFENFFGLDGETLAWANGKAVPLHTGDFIQAPPRHLHGFRLTQQYNRFAAFLTPGIFENFFTRGAGAPDVARGGARGGDGSGRGRAPARGGPPDAAALRQMFTAIQMSGRGPDGYPLDVHPPKLALPPQDPAWTGGGGPTELSQRMALFAHASAICGATTLSRDITPELRRALALKPRQTDFL